MKPYSENYRVVERNSQHNIGPNNMGRFGIFEAHYGGDGELAIITTLPIAPTAKTVEELKALLQEYLQALEQPIIQFDDVPKHHRELN